MTEQEYIRQCSTEQLADVVFNIITTSNDFLVYLMNVEGKTENEIKGAIIEWLKVEHKDGIQ